MNRNELQENLNAAQEKVNKRMNTINKILVKLNDEEVNKEVKRIAYEIRNYLVRNNELQKYYTTNETRNDLIYNLYDNYLKLREVEKVRNNWQEKLNREINIEDALIEVPALRQFLNEWKAKAYDWYVENSKRYIELYQEWAAKKESSYTLSYKKEFFSSISELTKNLTSLSRKQINTVALNKILDKEVEVKYRDLIARVTKKVGTITDVSNLYIGVKNGELNGVVIGTNGRAEVETISAGGYNIQCFHYRVLVK